MSPLIFGFALVIAGAVSAGVFGLQYRVMRRYTVDNSALLSIFVLTIVVPLIAVPWLLPDWTSAIAAAGWRTNLLVFALGFGWGLGCITYAYGFNILGLALGASLIKGITVAVGSGIPLARRWHDLTPQGEPALDAAAKATTIIGIALLLVGTALCGRAGIKREKEITLPSSGSSSTPTAGTTRFLLGLFCCLFSGVLSACANLGYDYAAPIEAALGRSELNWRTTLIRWLPLYWGGITALLIFLGGKMLRNGTWRNYIAPDSGRDFLLSFGLGFIVYFGQIFYGIGALYLGRLGTTVGWGVTIGMALIVAAALGFICGEWRQASKAALRSLLTGLFVLLLAMAVLAYANSLAQ